MVLSQGKWKSFLLIAIVDMILSSWSNWAENCTQVYVAKSVSLSIVPSVRVLT